jgi:hypothetical protein
MTMSKTSHIALSTALAFILIPPASVLVPSTFAGALPASTSKIKKHKKHKKNKEIVLKGHRGHSKKPA